MRVVIVSNTTMQPIAPYLSQHEVRCSGTGDLPAWLVTEESPAATEADLVLIHCDADTVLPPLAADDTADFVLDRIEHFARAHPGIPVVSTTLVPFSGTVSSFADAKQEFGRMAASSRWNARLCELARNLSNFHIMDLTQLLRSATMEQLTSETYWYLGRIRFSTRGFELLAAEIDAFIRGLTSRARKVLVLDLDNTLWGGVIGEVGIGGIDLSEDGVGKCFRDLQMHVERLRRDGTLLCVSSKNDLALVEEALAEHPMMVVRHDSFVSIRADWSNKVDHILSMAESLGLATDSFVFLDDNPVERDLVRSSLPEVAVPDFPERPESLVSWFVNEVAPRYFPRVQILDEDRVKTEQYRAREQRQAAKSADLDDFLNTLEIRLDFRIDDERLTARMNQLTQKTNQFNLTTRRIDPHEMAAMATSRDFAVISVDYEDRFGQEGTIGPAIVDLANGHLENLLLSCRVIGRGVETHLLEHVEQVAKDHGHAELSASFISSERNRVASSFLPEHGFAGEECGGIWKGTKALQ